MLNTKKHVIFCLAIFSIFILLLSIVACEPGVQVTIENQQNQNLLFFIAHVRDNGTLDKLTKYGTIPANTVKTFNITFLGDKWVNRLQLEDINGNILFVHDYNMKGLNDINAKIVVP
jgi:hypothetical protein